MDGGAPSLEGWWAARWSSREGLAELLGALAELSAALGRVDNVGSAIFDLRPRQLAPPGGPPPAPAPDPWGEGRPVPADDERALSGALAPEVLFGCRREAPEAGHVWSIGLCLLSLLGLAEVARAGAPPPLGTDTPSLRPLRSTLIHDVHRRKPAMFAGRRLPHQEFLYPEALPEADAAAALRALQSMREAGAAVDSEAVLEVLTGALMVAPGARTPSLARLAEALRAAAAACLRAPPLERGPPPPALPPQADGALAGLIERLEALERRAAAQGEGSGVALAAGLAQLERSAAADRAEIAALKAALVAAEAKLSLPTASPAAPPAPRGADWLARVGVLVVALVAIGLGLRGGPTASSPAPIAAPAPTARPAPSSAAALAEAVPEPSAPEAPAEPPGPSAEASRAPPTDKARPEPVRPEPARAKDREAVEREAGPTEPPALPGRLVVRGGTATLVGPGGAADPARVAPGAYRLKARPADGKELDLGSVNVASGAVISVVCGFGTCKRE